MISDKITFIIPSLNRPTLVNSIDSLLKQKNPNWECIIIYDGVEGRFFDDERIKIINIEKTGISSNKMGQSGLVRNYGIKETKTSWIGFLDDDDTINPNYVDDLFKKYSNYDFVIWRMKDKLGNIYPPLKLKKIIFGQVGISIAYKNKFDNVLFDSNRNGEDFDIVKKLLSLTNNFIVTPEIYYNVRY